MAQRLEKWPDLSDVPAPARSVSVSYRDHELALTLYWHGAADRAPMRLTVSDVLAFTSYDEHHHPDGLDASPGPSIDIGPWPDGAWPIVEVKESAWVESFGPKRRWQFEGARHLRIYSLDNTVDVLFEGQIHAQ